MGKCREKLVPCRSYEYSEPGHQGYESKFCRDDQNKEHFGSVIDLKGTNNAEPEQNSLLFLIGENKPVFQKPKKVSLCFSMQAPFSLLFAP